jgi:hypothetical protein
MNFTGPGTERNRTPSDRDQHVRYLRLPQIPGSYYRAAHSTAPATPAAARDTIHWQAGYAVTVHSAPDGPGGREQRLSRARAARPAAGGRRRRGSTPRVLILSDGCSETRPRPGLGRGGRRVRVQPALRLTVTRRCQQSAAPAGNPQLPHCSERISARPAPPGPGRPSPSHRHRDPGLRLVHRVRVHLELVLASDSET